MIDYFYTRERHAYPIYQLDYKLYLNKVISLIESIENLHICGRNGLFRYIFMDRAMEMGVETARLILRK